MDKLMPIILTIILIGGGAFAFKVNSSLEDQIKELKRKDKISINSGVLSEVSQLTLSKIKINFAYVHKKSGTYPAPWKGIYEYQWEFEYQFGINVPKGWKWNFREPQEGIVSIDVPPLAQLNDYNIKINLIDRINRANGIHSAEMQRETDAIALQRVKEVETQYLTNPSIIETTRRSLETFFLNLLNERNKGMPVRKVEVNFAK